MKSNLGWLIVALIVTAAGVLAAAFLRSGWWYGAPAALSLGGVWLAAAGHRFTGRRAADVTLVLWVVLAAIGVVLAAPFALVVVSVVLALAAWDAGQFGRWLKHTGATDDAGKLIGAHFRRAAVVFGAGLILAVIAERGELRIRFGWILLLSLGLVLGLGWGFDYLRRRLAAEPDTE